MSDQRPQDEQAPPNSALQDQPAEGGDVPDAGAGAEHADATPSTSADSGRQGD